MSARHTELENDGAETEPPRPSWQSPRTWALFAADAAYCGVVAGAVTIIACLVASLFHELKADSIEGWWLVFIAMAVLSGLHLGLVERWLLPSKPARPIGLREALPGGSGGALLGSFSLALSILAGIALVAIAQELPALPDAWEWQLPNVAIAAVINEGAFFRLLYDRTRDGSGS